MEAQIAPSRIKLFSRALICLSKIGSSILMECLLDRIILRGLGDSHSAYAHFYFLNTFFSQFKYFIPQTSNQISSSQIHHSLFRVCLDSKSVLSCFRSLSSNDN